MPEAMDLIDDEHSEVRKRWKLEEDLREAKAEIKRANARADRAEARSEVAVAALAGGANPSVLVDVMGRIDHAGWTMKDGHPVMLNSDGTVRSNIGPDEWIKNLRPSAPHLFAQPGDAAPTQGTAAPGARGGGRPIPTGWDNPWSKDGWNDTAQARIYLEQGADRAKAMAEAAGSRIGALPPK